MPRGAAEPEANPLRNPPAPDLPKRRPGRPRKDDPTAPSHQAAAAPPPPTAPPTWAELPPEVKAQKIQEAAPTTAMCLAVLSAAATRLPPARPLSDEERAALRDPLAECIAKWDVSMSPEWRLGLALLGVAGLRYLEASGADLLAPPPATPAGEQTVQVK